MLTAVVGVAFLLSGPCDLPRSRSLATEARAAARAHQFEESAGKFLQAYQACSEHRGLKIEQANSLLMARRFNEAMDAAQDVLKSDPANSDALKIRGNAEYLSGNHPAAISTFIGLLERYPTDEDAAYMLGRMYYQEGQPEQAMGQFQRVLKLNPRAYRAWDNLGLCWQALGDRNKAAAHFLQAVRLVEKDHPEYDLAYANLAELLLQTEDNQHAFAAASKAADRNPLSARNFYIGAKALDKLGKSDLCINWLERAASLDPTYPEPQYLMVRVYRKLGQNDKADAALERFRSLKNRP